MHPKVTNLPKQIPLLRSCGFFVGTYKDPAPREPFCNRVSIYNKKAGLMDRKLTRGLLGFDDSQLRCRLFAIAETSANHHQPVRNRRTGRRPNIVGYH